MKPTRFSALLFIALVAAAVSWTVLSVLDVSRPSAVSGSWLDIPWTLPVALAFVACGILVAALSLRSRLRGRPGSRPVDPIAAARMAALAKATSHVGAGILGVYVGVVVFLLPGNASELRRERLLMAALAVLAAASLVVAGLVLERICRVKPPKDEQLLPPAPG